MINGRQTDILSTFKRLPDGDLAATPADLQTAGIKPDGGQLREDGLIPLSTLPGVTVRYDEARQLVEFTASDDARTAHEINVGGGGPAIDLDRVRSDYGFVTNYTLYGGAQYDWSSDTPTYFLSGSFDARLMSPYGVLSSSALGRVNAFDDFDDASNEIVRLESSYRYTDPSNLFVYQAGDTISGSLPWSSAVRIGGLQFQRNFNIRPDLITSPVPNLAGTAGVPSSLDLYLNNIRVFSGQVPAGPFDFTGLPFLGGGGNARIVMKDELGREVVREVPYYFTPDLLQEGLFDFSVEAGFPRLGYGSDSFKYESTLVASGSARYGFSNWFTGEAHLEGTRGLINGGVGFVSSLGPYGGVNAAVAASSHEGKIGGKVYGLYQVAREGISFYASTERLLGDYEDLPSVIARWTDDDTPLSSRAREIDRLGITMPLYFDESSIGLGYTRIAGTDDGDSDLLTASWSRTIFDDVSIYVSAYGDLRSSDDYGVFAGLTVPLGGDMTATANVSRSGDQTTFGADVTKSARLEEGAYGWSVRDRESIGGDALRSASVNYRAAVAYLEGSVEQAGDSGRVTGTIDGSIVAAGGGVFMANRVDDAFAVVKAGGPDIDVTLNGRRVATTNSGGRAFVPYLQSYQNNTVAIDPANLQVDLQPQTTQDNLIPADRSGVVVDFGVRKVEAAVVTLFGADRQPLPVGAEVTLDGTDQQAVVGYDGRVYLTELSPTNAVTVALPEAKGTCRASFEYRSVPGTQPEIGPVMCQ